MQHSILYLTLDQVFNLTNSIAAIAWALMIFTPNWHWTEKIVYSLFVPFILSIIYIFTMIAFPGEGGLNFNSLDGVAGMFAQREVVLVGWIHYLAFDLTVGIWIKQNARKHEIRHLIIVVPLLFTFMLGPVGLVMYLVLRTVILKDIAANNF